MKFGGTFNKNWSAANGSGVKDFQKDVLLDEIARVIELDRPKIISLLNESGYKISSSATKKEIIDKTVSALFRSNQFKADITKLIVQTNIPKYSNADGQFLDKIKGFFSGSKSEDVPKGSASGAGAGASGPVASIASAIGSIFNFAATSKQQKIQEQQAKQDLYNKLLTDNDKKTNWAPIIIIGGVLVAGTIVAIVALRKK